jgi:hypothetical protein
MESRLRAAFAVFGAGALENGFGRPGKRVASDPDDLRKVVEVPVPRVQDEIVLKNQSRQPNVVRGNGRSLFSELQKHSGVVMRRLVICE